MSESDNGDTASAYVVPDSKPGRVPTKDFKPLTFNIEDVKRTMHSADGDHTKLTKKQQGQLQNLGKAGQRRRWGNKFDGNNQLLKSTLKTKRNRING